MLNPRIIMRAKWKNNEKIPGFSNPSVSDGIESFK
jgi:hypothetical protein